MRNRMNNTFQNGIAKLQGPSPKEVWMAKGHQPVTDDADMAAGKEAPDMKLYKVQHPQHHHHHHNNSQHHHHHNPNYHLGYGSETDLLSVADADSSGSDSDSDPDELMEKSLVVFGRDLSNFSRAQQFITCAAGVFGFSLLYGFLQELISVQLCNRKLGLFQATAQFGGYTIWAFMMRNISHKKKQKPMFHKSQVPFQHYIGLSLLRALDLGCTNLAMQYMNYPAKTLMKSSRVVFTMLFGVIFKKRSYRLADYLVVLLMVLGLAIFMHADANSSAVFSPVGIIMLLVSLLCDGAISNMSEIIMTRYDVSQDEFIFNLYSIAFLAISGAAFVQGDLQSGLSFLTKTGTYQMDTDSPDSHKTWTSLQKIIVFLIFSTTGFLSSSCSTAITKHFGALTMSITSTARKATTLFLSFALFNNACTVEHIFGVILFIISLVAKSLRASKYGHHHKKQPLSNQLQHQIDLQQPPSNSFLLHSKQVSRRLPHSTNTVSDIV